MSNPYFKNTFAPNNNESELFRKAADEIIEAYGIDFKYILRTSVNQDFIFGEDNLTKYDGHRTVTMYVDNYQDFDGVDDMFSKFGFQVDNKLTLNIERVRIKSIIGREPEIDDLLYHIASGKIFAIKHINNDIDFYVLNGNRYLYRLTCELYIPSYETMDTNIDDVDSLNDVIDSDTTDEDDQFYEEGLVNIDFNETDIFGNL